MTGKVFFNESQKMDQLWLKLVMAMAAVITVVPFLLMEMDQLWQIETIMTLLGLIFALVFTNVIIFAVTFQTKITSDGIYYKYPPFVRKWKKVAFQELEDYGVRKYHAFREFGGRGYKTRFFATKARAITIKGDQGLQLYFKNGKKLLLGTQKPEELKIALKKARGAESEDTWQRKRHLH